MMLIAVTEVDELVNLNAKLGVDKIIKKDCKTINGVYKAFRNIVPNGRYSLLISENPHGNKPLYVMDTQVIAKEIFREILNKP